MEENIKILEGIVNKMKKNNFIIQYKDLYISDTSINSLENLLKAYKEDEAVIEEMAQSIYLLPNVDFKSAEDVIKRFRNKVKGEKE